VELADLALELLGEGRIARLARLAPLALETLATAEIAIEVAHAGDVVRCDELRSGAVVDAQKPPRRRAGRHRVDVESALGRGRTREDTQQEARGSRGLGEAIDEAENVVVHRVAQLV